MNASADSLQALTIMTLPGAVGAFVKVDFAASIKSVCFACEKQL
jgi:hypothetical protein